VNAKLPVQLLENIEDYLSEEMSLSAVAPELPANSIQKVTAEFWTARQRSGHKLHEISYRACFKSQLPEYFITRLTQPGDVVYDCFMGRGTTLIEAAIHGRIPIGSDINPLSQFLCKPRLNPPSYQQVEQRLNSIDLSYDGPLKRDLRVFYHPTTLRQLYALRRHLLENENDEVDSWIRMVATNRLSGHSTGFFSVYSMPPNQAVTADRQRLINKKCKQKPEPKDIISRILKKSKRMLEIQAITPQHRQAGRDAKLFTSPADQTKDIPSNSVSLVITSPPFLDIIDYAGDNWLRCWFNGINEKSVKISSFKKPEIWAEYMAKVLQELERILKPGGWIAFEVGEVKKGTVLLEEWVIKAAKQTKLEVCGVMIHQQKFTKTANCWGIDNQAMGTNTQRITILRKN